MRALDLHLQRVAQIGGATDMVDMAVGEPDLLDRDAGLLDRLQNFGNVPAGVDHHGLLGRLVPDDGAVLLEQRHRHDHRAGFGLVLGLGLGFVIHGWHHIHPGKVVNTGLQSSWNRRVIHTAP